MRTPLRAGRSALLIWAGLALLSPAAFAQAGPPSGDKDAPLIARTPAPRIAAPNASPVQNDGLGNSGGAGLLTSISADDMLKLATEAGFPARWVNAPDGERVLVAQIDAVTPFQIILQDCVTAQQNCVDFELYAGFDTPKRPSQDQINRFNREKTWNGFGYLTPQGAPALRAQYTLAGGVSREHLTILIKAWGANLKNFLAHIEFVPGAVQTARAKP